ncbi:NAD-dependent epimerase/dehydratase family protein, partial [Nocardia farcinica]|uniref:NAD-dependent epimerase/dehydratase family protein n=1 Tax=Nocardia farcinica TaxID=37329 RepID=UPI0024565B75
MRVLVTGATGYVGRAVVSALRTRGHEPVALVRTPGARVADAAEIRVADLLDGSALRRALAGGDRPRAAAPGGSAAVGCATAGSAPLGSATARPAAGAG